MSIKERKVMERPFSLLGEGVADKREGGTEGGTEG